MNNNKNENGIEQKQNPPQLEKKEINKFSLIDGEIVGEKPKKKIKQIKVLKYPIVESKKLKGYVFYLSDGKTEKDLLLVNDFADFNNLLNDAKNEFTIINENRHKDGKKLLSDKSPRFKEIVIKKIIRFFKNRGVFKSTEYYEIVKYFATGFGMNLNGFKQRLKIYSVLEQENLNLKCYKFVRGLNPYIVQQNSLKNDLWEISKIRFKVNRGVKRDLENAINQIKRVCSNNPDLIAKNKENLIVLENRLNYLKQNPPKTTKANPPNIPVKKIIRAKYKRGKKSIENIGNKKIVFTYGENAKSEKGFIMSSKIKTLIGNSFIPPPIYSLNRVKNRDWEIAKIKTEKPKAKTESKPNGEIAKTE